MQFINNWAFLGLFAIAIPIIIHFINLRKIQIIEFPSLFFLKELKKNKLKKLKFLNLLLLLLRILFIVFLTFAIARPVLKNSFFIPLPSASTATVFIIDDTFSMNNYSDDNITNFNKAKDIIYKFKNIAKSNDQIAIIPLSNISNSISLSPVNNKLFENIKDLSINYGNDNFIDAFNLAIEYLSKATTVNKEIFIISDFQSNLFDNYDYNKLTKLSKVSVYFIPFSLNQNRNLAITKAKINNKFIGISNNISLSFDVKNFYKEEINNIIYSIYLNDKKVSQNHLNISANNIKTIYQEIALSNEEFNRIKIELSKDDNIFDNYYYLCVKNPPQISILNLYDNPKNLYYIQKALEADISKKIKFTNYSVNDISKIDLSNYNLIILSIDKYSNSLEKLRNYILNNRIGLIVIPGIGADLTNFNLILDALQLPKSIAFTTDQDTKIKEIPKGSIYSDIFKNKNDFNEITVQKYYQFHNQKSFINLTNNDNFIIHTSIKNNNILIFSTPFEMNFSDFQIKSLFIPVIYNSIYFVSNNNLTNNNFTISKYGIPLNYNLLNNINIITPENKNIIPLQQQKTINLTTPGFYKIIENGKIIDIISVNFNTNETNLQTYNIDNIIYSLNNDNYFSKTVHYMPNITNEITQARSGIEYWPIFLILSIFLLFLEIVISNNLVKRRRNYE